MEFIVLIGRITLLPAVLPDLHFVDHCSTQALPQSTGVTTIQIGRAITIVVVYNSEKKCAACWDYEVALNQVEDDE